MHLVLIRKNNRTEKRAFSGIELSTFEYVLFEKLHASLLKDWFFMVLTWSNDYKKGKHV